jgi:hypothetical protein
VAVALTRDLPPLLLLLLRAGRRRPRARPPKRGPRRAPSRRRRPRARPNRRRPRPRPPRPTPRARPHPRQWRYGDALLPLPPPTARPWTPRTHLWTDWSSS